jgi:maltose O-acetyltransferase
MKEVFKYPMILLRAFKDDIIDGRIRLSIFLGLANLLPDLYVCGYIRPFFWWAAGVKIDVFGSSFIRKNVWVDVPSKLEIGHHFHVNRGTIISAHGGIKIGDHVTLSFLNGLHTIDHSAEKPVVLKIAPIVIGDNSIIYSHSIILPGVTIGKNVVIGTGVSVFFDVPDNSKVLVNKPRVI